MAAMSSTFPAQTPASAPLYGSVAVVGQQYCAPNPVDLTITKKALSLTDGDFVVVDVNGNLVFKVKGIFLSLHGRRILLDPAGTPILCMKEKILTAHSRWHVFRGDSTEPNDLLYTLKKSSMFQFFKTELDVFMAGNNDEKVPDFKVKGNYLERSCTVYLGESNSIVAQISRKYTVTNILLGKDTFGMTVYPNVDYAFITSLIVILDDIHREKIDND